jgi:hypothetical protein
LTTRGRELRRLQGLLTRSANTKLNGILKRLRDSFRSFYAFSDEPIKYAVNLAFCVWNVSKKTCRFVFNF